MHEDIRTHRKYWKTMAADLHQAKRYAEALRVYRQAILLNPEDADLCFNLGNLLHTIGQAEKALAVFEHAYRLRPTDLDTLINLAPLYRSTQRLDEARSCYEKILQLDPGNSTALYFLSALDGKNLDRAPAAYIVELFDQYAATYDNHMNTTLQYKVPELLLAMLQNYAPTRQRRFLTCDLGCGTGRSMEAFTRAISSVDGYDLSPEMLKRAAEKKIYRQLIVGDCIETLATSGSYELYVAADLLPYLGELDSLFAIIRDQAKTSAYLLVSTELQESGSTPRLQTTGRYAHSLRYVQSRIRAHAMRLRAFQQKNLRLQAERPIQGGLYLIEV